MEGGCAYAQAIRRVLDEVKGVQLIGQQKEPLSWKSLPIFGLLTLVTAKVKEKGIFAAVRVHTQDSQTKVKTVFDWDSEEYADLFQQAKTHKDT